MSLAHNENAIGTETMRNEKMDKLINARERRSI